MSWRYSENLSSLLLEPSNEGLKGELFRQSAARGGRSRSSRAGNGSLSSDRCGSSGRGSGGGGSGASSNSGRENSRGSSSGCGDSSAVGSSRGGRSRRRVARAAAGGNRTTRGGVGRGIEAVVDVGNVNVGILSVVGARKGDGWAACTLGASTGDLELRAANVELGTTNSLSTVESKHLRAEEVLSAGEAGRQLELVGHVAGLHDLVGPLAVDLILLIDLEPASTDTSCLRSIVDGSVQEVSDGARVARAVPLDLDGVTLSGGNGLDARGNLGTTDVASHIVRLDIGDGAIGRRHPNANLVAGSLIVDPELVEVLVSGGSAEKGGSNDSLGEHLEVYLVGRCCVKYVQQLTQ